MGEPGLDSKGGRASLKRKAMTSYRDAVMGLDAGFGLLFSLIFDPEELDAGLQRWPRRTLLSLPG
jgi:hypothetical protein